MGQRDPAKADENPDHPPKGSVAYYWTLAGIVCTGLASIVAAWVVRDQPVISYLYGHRNFFPGAISFFIAIGSQLLLLCAYCNGRYSAPISIGWPLKLAMDLMALLLALSIALLHSWNTDMLLTLFLLVICTIYVHALVQLRFRPRDMGIVDLMLHVSMESLVCLIPSGSRVCIALILLLCAAIILCRCLFYSATKGGCHFEKDKEDDEKSDQATNSADSTQVSDHEKSRRLDLLFLC
ncbi:sodium/hydrogen exchanger 11 [Corchorus capsularis]|uniref:Sodium/hydrogen exchanger 11 n=1 Tax=Corchorus capsularis TaxID=210143 RepID=A0A1R3HX22_COCAP|nr:sodium/hydrogen exchanger 11 [Corchorus capsularis]